MKPDVDRFMEVAAAHVVMRIAPKLGPGYEQSSMLVLMALLNSAREETERAASRRVEENRELRRIFAEAGPAVVDAALREGLDEAAAGEDTDFAISALERSNAGLRALLIDLHAHIEELDSAEARAIDTQIWQELARSTERRKLVMGPY